MRKADVLERSGCFVHDDACNEHGGNGDEYGDGVFAGEIAAAVIPWGRGVAIQSWVAGVPICVQAWAKSSLQ